MPDMIQICSECNRPIEDQFVMRVADSILHEQCLRCLHCGEFLTESCFRHTASNINGLISNLM